VNVSFDAGRSDFYFLTLCELLEIVATESDGVLVLCSFNRVSAAFTALDGGWRNRQTVMMNAFDLGFDAMLRAGALAAAGDQGNYSDEPAESGD
jgi:hypothetical protein